MLTWFACEEHVVIYLRNRFVAFWYKDCQNLPGPLKSELSVCNLAILQIEAVIMMANPVENPFQEGRTWTRRDVPVDHPDAAEAKPLVKPVGSRRVGRGSEHHGGVFVCHRILHNLLSQLHADSTPPPVPVDSHPLQFDSTSWLLMANCCYDTHHFSLQHCHPQARAWGQGQNRGRVSKEKDYT